MSAIYSLIFSKPLNNPSTAKTEGALVDGVSPQQLSSNFLILYSVYSIPDLLNRSIASLDSAESSNSKMGLRPTILYIIYDSDIKSYLVPLVDLQYIQERFTDSIDGYNEADSLLMIKPIVKSLQMIPKSIIDNYKWQFCKKDAIHLTIWENVA